MGMKVRKFSRQKTDRLQKGDWNDKGLTGDDYMRVYSHF